MASLHEATAMKIRIKTTNRKVPRSIWVTAILSKQFISNRGIAYPLVTDITIPDSLGSVEMWQQYEMEQYDIRIGNVTGHTSFKSLADELNKPKQPLYKRLTKLFKRRK